MGGTDRDGPQAPTRVAELKDKIQQATELIGELRETNYSLSSEVAELKRELDSRPERDADASVSDATAAAGTEETNTEDDFSAEIEALRKERQTIREKVSLLLERIERLET